MTHITEKQIAYYLSVRGVRCPVCKDTNLRSTDDVQTDAGIAWQAVTCDNCGAQWEDLYDLTGVRSVDDSK